jgi:hypothetical protein
MVALRTLGSGPREDEYGLQASSGRLIETSGKKIGERRVDRRDRQGTPRNL